MEKVVLGVDFEKQLDKRPIDRETDEIEEELEREIERLKTRGLKPSLLEARIDELTKRTASRVAIKYQTFHNARLNIAKHNIGHFYAHLYQAIFGGKLLRKFKTEKEPYQNGNSGEEEQRNFHPDHIRFIEGRKIFSEVKAVSHKNSKPFCGSTQLENYCHDLLRDAFETMFSPELEYAFFRYRHRTDGEKRTASLANWELKRKLSSDTRDLLIVPANALFLMFLSSNGNWINQENNKGPDEEFYWKIYGSLISRMHIEQNPLVDIAGNLEHGVEFARELCLQDIDVERSVSPGNIYCCGRRVIPFHVTRYYNKTGKWLENFKKNHGKILVEHLGVRDLYQEFKVPF